MIGNKYLQQLYDYPDIDASLNQLLELLKYKNKDFIDSLFIPVDLSLCSKDELNFLTKVAALIDYNLQIHKIAVPEWLRNNILRFEVPYYHSKRISDFEKFKLQMTNPGPFRARNVYFDLTGIGRI